MLDEKELTQVRDYVIKILPELLRSEPEIGITIEGILAQHFPRRDEFARLLEEVREFRQEVNQRFEQVDGRFEQVDQRLGKLETTQLAMRRDIAQLKSGQDHLLKEFRTMSAWFQLIQGDAGTNKGKMLEDAVAAGLRYGLKNPHIKAENLRLRQKLVDPDGSVFFEGYESEVDLIVSNGELTVFEVKASGNSGEVGDFERKLRLLRAQNPDKKVSGIYIALGADEHTKALAERYGIELVD